MSRPRALTDAESREIGRLIGDFLVAVGHPLTCNGGNPDWRGHHDHEVLMLTDETNLICPECGRVQTLPASMIFEKE